MKNNIEFTFLRVVYKALYNLPFVYFYSETSQPLALVIPPLLLFPEYTILAFIHSFNYLSRAFSVLVTS